MKKRQPQNPRPRTTPRTAGVTLAIRAAPAIRAIRAALVIPAIRATPDADVTLATHTPHATPVIRAAGATSGTCDAPLTYAACATRAARSATAALLLPLVVIAWQGISLHSAVAQTQTAHADAESSQPFNLRPVGWVAGQTSRYEFWNRIENTVESRFAGKSDTQSTTTIVAGELTWVVNQTHADGSASCTLTLDWMTLTTNPPGSHRSSANASGKKRSAAKPTTTDSRKRPAEDDQKTMYELLAAITHVPVKIEVAPDGHITSVSGLAAMKAKTTHPEYLPSALDFEESASDLATLIFAPPPEVFTPLRSDSSASAGDHATSTGNSKKPTAKAAAGSSAASSPESSSSNTLDMSHTSPWKSDVTWEHDMGKINQRWTYQFDRLETLAGVPVAVVVGQAKLKLLPDFSDRPADAPPMKVKLLEGSAQTQVWFDLSRHEAVGRELNTAEKIQVTITLPNGKRFERILTERIQSQTLRLSED